jgi:branched-chain amino acid transport system ATP-binding protein
MSAEPVLSVSDLHVSYGRIEVLHGVDLEVNEGEIVALVGANGAGKSTLLKTISGLIRPRRGKVHLGGRDVTGWSPHKLVRAGIAQVPEGRRVFPRFDIRENLRVGGYVSPDFRTNGAEIERVIASVPALERRKSSLAGELSGGEQQLLAVQRALMSKPKLLLMDEPSMGLAPVLVDGIFDLIQQLNRDGTTVLLVEQNAVASMGIAQRAYVLAAGKVVMSGAAAELAARPEFSSAYLGI